MLRGVFDLVKTGRLLIGRRPVYPVILEDGAPDPNTGEDGQLWLDRTGPGLYVRLNGSWMRVKLEADGETDSSAGPRSDSSGVQDRGQTPPPQCAHWSTSPWQGRFDGGQVARATVEGGQCGRAAGDGFRAAEVIPKGHTGGPYGECGLAEGAGRLPAQQSGGPGAASGPLGSYPKGTRAAPTGDGSDVKKRRQRRRKDDEGK